ncbi:hemicentin-1 [Elysia marginata]|uniref:Hemicentin-1 n=1 Tax=Elysia marginata TaxID=1093978 RepID=A0AAV4IXB7_9GAST|nr:hemicentin-1 [Elysia marginata]
MAATGKIALTLLTLAAVQVTWGPARGNEAVERSRMVQRLHSINRTADYVEGILRHASSNLQRYKQSTGAEYPNYELIAEKLETVRRDLEQVSEKVEVVSNNGGDKMVRDIKALKTSTRTFHKSMKNLTSELKVSARSLKGQMRVQANRSIKLLERGGKALMERVKRLPLPDTAKKTAKGGEDAREGEGNEKEGSLIRGQDEDPRLARQEVVSTSITLDGGRSLMDMSRMDRYLDRCPSCMVPLETYQCPLHGPALDMQKWARQLQDLVSFGCAIPVPLETYQCPLHGPALDMQKWARQLQDLVSFGCAIPDGCDANTKCCLSSDPEVRKAIASVTKTLRDLYTTFQKSCTKCNKKMQDEARPDEWTNWGPWGACDVTCGREGRRRRERRCVRPTSREASNRCEGQATQVGRCPEMAPCEIIEWSSWGSWSSCDVTCGRNGRRKRERQCVSNPSGRRSNRCSGQAVEMGRCPAMAACESKSV